MNDVKAQAEFTEFVLREMPAGTIISDPAWWAPRLWRAAVHAMRHVGDWERSEGWSISGATAAADERARFEAWAATIALDLDRHSGGEYVCSITYRTWAGWQARAKIAADHLGDANKMVGTMTPQQQLAELIEAAHLVGCFPSEARLAHLAAALRKLTQDAS